MIASTCRQKAKPPLALSQSAHGRNGKMRKTRWKDISRICLVCPSVMLSHKRIYRLYSRHCHIRAWSAREWQKSHDFGHAEGHTSVYSARALSPLHSTDLTYSKALIIDVGELAKASSDAALVSALANQTGYWPVFSFLNSVNNLIDLASVGLIGQKGAHTSIFPSVKTAYTWSSWFELFTQ